MLKNKTKIFFVPFVRHIELQNFLIATRIYRPMTAAGQ